MAESLGNGENFTKGNLYVWGHIDALRREIFLPAQEKNILCPGKNIFPSRERFRLFLPRSQLFSVFLTF